MTIEVNDLVAVCFVSGETMYGEVKYIPMATGDCWRIVNKTGELFYIQNFEAIRLIKKNVEPTNER